PQLAAALQTLELTIRRRLDGLLHGSYQGLLPGPGSEPGEAREYQPGDDVRLMDWSVTARTTVPHVRMPVADRELETWLVVDLSASLDFGTVGGVKRDLAIAAAAAMTHLTMRGGNRVGAIVTTGPDLISIPAHGGEAAARTLLRTLATTETAPEGSRGDLTAGLEALRRRSTRRGLVVVISDFLGPIDWARALRGVAGRHEVLGIEVLDPRDVTLSDLGRVTLRDPESGAVRDFRVTERLQADFARAAEDHRAAVRAEFGGVGGPVMGLRTDVDWIGDIARFVATNQRRSAGIGAKS